MRLADQIVYCSSCHGQYLDRQHVDLEAYYDGPALQTGPLENTITVPIDDLVLCDQCLTEAGKIIGLIKADDIKTENIELGQAVETKNDEIIELHETISDMQKTLAHFTDEKIQRPARKPRMVESV